MDERVCPYCNQQGTLVDTGETEALSLGRTAKKLLCDEKKGGCGGYSFLSPPLTAEQWAEIKPVASITNPSPV